LRKGHQNKNKKPTEEKPWKEDLKSRVRRYTDFACGDISPKTARKLKCERENFLMDFHVDKIITKQKKSVHREYQQLRHSEVKLNILYFL